MGEKKKIKTLRNWFRDTIFYQEGNQKKKRRKQVIPQDLAFSNQFKKKRKSSKILNSGPSTVPISLSVN